jgi:hypothetical protein
MILFLFFFSDTTFIMLKAKDSIPIITKKIPINKGIIIAKNVISVCVPGIKISLKKAKTIIEIVIITMVSIDNIIPLKIVTTEKITRLKESRNKYK